MARRFCHLLLCTPLLLPIPGGVDLFAYQQLIHESARKFPGMAWYLYDMEFRRRASHNLSINWGQRDVQLYLDTFTGVPKAILCKACSSSDHVTDSCPLSPRSTDSSGSKRGDLCFNFNKGVLCARTPCPYTHQCNKPGCTAAHPGKEGVTFSPHLTCNYLRTPLDPRGMVAISMGNGFRLLGSLNTSLTPPWVSALTGRNCLQFTLPAISGSLRGQANICMWCDNLPVVSIINSKRSKSPRIMELIQAITILTLEHNFSFTARHIPGLDNSIADSLTRFQMDRFRHLAPNTSPSPCAIPLSATSI